MQYVSSRLVAHDYPGIPTMSSPPLPFLDSCISYYHHAPTQSHACMLQVSPANCLLKRKMPPINPPSVVKGKCPPQLEKASVLVDNATCGVDRQQSPRKRPSRSERSAREEDGVRFGCRKAAHGGHSSSSPESGKTECCFDRSLPARMENTVFEVAKSRPPESQPNCARIRKEK